LATPQSNDAPIVFLVLPTVVAIALFPGVVGLHLTA
jgi:hypothetical protein